MKRACISAVVSVLALCAIAQETTHQLNNASLNMALDQYMELTGKKVEIVQGVKAVVTVLTAKKLTPAEQAEAIVQELNNQNVGLFLITTNRLVAAWIDSSKAPETSGPKSYGKLLEKRRQELKQKDSVQH